MARIVLVDDHPNVRSALRIALEVEGHEVVAEAEDSVRALYAVEAHSPDIVLSDLHMAEDLEGYKLVRELKSTHPDLPVIICSADSAGDREREALEAGAAGYFEKSTVPISRLRALIERALTDRPAEGSQ